MVQVIPSPTRLARNVDIHAVMRILRQVSQDLPVPYVTRLANETHDPFRVLISTILSLRTKDAATEKGSERLFALARTPDAMVRLPVEDIITAIAPVLYSTTKAGNIHRICQILIDEYDRRVPADLEQLDALPGVGRKTANLVITLGFGLPGICVDTHVHRITNRWGYVVTQNPDDTELALRALLPCEYWIEINSELVSLGQNVCLPVSPKCSGCQLRVHCARIGVTHNR